jgi:hypothetical protein
LKRDKISEVLRIALSLISLRLIATSENDLIRALFYVQEDGDNKYERYLSSLEHRFLSPSPFIVCLRLNLILFVIAQPTSF